jgi:limonene-1,2-epoxide hydrolase
MADAPQTPIDVVMAFTAAVGRKDYDSAVKLVSDTCEYDNVPMMKVHGPKGVRAVLEPFFAPTIENEFIFLRVAADGPLLFTERLDRHLLADGWVELPVTGVWEVHDGKITLWRDYFDAQTILKAWPAPLG